MTSDEVKEQIVKLAKKGLTPSQIGVILRDSHGVAQVRYITGNKILRILKAKAFGEKSKGQRLQVPIDFDRGKNPSIGTLLEDKANLATNLEIPILNSICFGCIVVLICLLYSLI